MSRIDIEENRGPQVAILVDGAPLPAYSGETVAAALIAAGRSAWRTSRSGGSRGLYCAIGICFECALTVNGVAEIRACQTQVTDGMVIETGRPESGRP